MATTHIEGKRYAHRKPVGAGCMGTTASAGAGGAGTQCPSFASASGASTFAFVFVPQKLQVLPADAGADGSAAASPSAASPSAASPVASTSGSAFLLPQKLQADCCSAGGSASSIAVWSLPRPRQ